MLQAELLRRCRLRRLELVGRALLRATRFLYGRAGWAADGDDEWQPWLIDRRYGTAYRGRGTGPDRQELRLHRLVDGALSRGRGRGASGGLGRRRVAAASISRSVMIAAAPATASISQ